MSAITLERYELEQIVSDTALRSAQLASRKTVEMLGLACPFLTLSEACKTYGRKRVLRWVKQGVVRKVSDGGNSACRLSVSELMQAAIGEDGFTFYKTLKTK